MQFLNFLTIIVVAHLSFLILFPDTGLGAILYLPISYTAWAIVAAIFALLKKRFKMRHGLEILFALAILIFLLFDFVQDGPSPIEQLQSGDWNLLKAIGVGLTRWVILLSASIVYLLTYIFLKVRKERTN